MALRVAFFGTPEFAVPTLTEIVGQGHDVAAVYTQPPRAAGRGLSERLSPVHQVATHFDLHVKTPATLRDAEAAAAFTDLAVDVGVIVAYGQILPKAFLDAARQGCLNLHASLLPRWRGAAPVNRAIMAGDAETGVMVMRMEEGLDTGPVAMAERVAIGPDATAGEVSEKLARLGADLMARALGALERGALTFTPQAADGVTYAKKIDKNETRIDWSRPARDVHNHIRGLSPDPGAWFEADLGKGPERIRALRSHVVTSLTKETPPLPTEHGSTRVRQVILPKSEKSDFGGERALSLMSASELGEKGEGADAFPTEAPGTVLADLTVACGEGAVRLTEVQRGGKAPAKAADFLRGLRAPLTNVG